MSDERPARAPFNWDKLTAITAVLIGACAVGVSLYTAFLQRSQVQAQTWPWLQIWRSDEANVLYLSNRGVGPARIEDVKLRVDDREVSGFDEALALILGHAPTALAQSYFARRVLATNEDVRMLQLPGDDYRALQTNRARMTLEICYCSVLGDCYVLDERAEKESDYIRAIGTCPRDHRGSFH